MNIAQMVVDSIYGCQKEIEKVDQDQENNAQECGAEEEGRPEDTCQEERTPKENDSEKEARQEICGRAQEARSWAKAERKFSGILASGNGRPIGWTIGKLAGTLQYRRCRF